MREYPHTRLAVGSQFHRLKQDLAFDLPLRLEGIATSIGFKYQIFLELPRADKMTFRQNMIANNWPTELISFYDANDFFYCSHLINALKRSIVPVFYEEGAFGGCAANHNNDALNEMFKRHGLNSTFAFTLHDAALRQYVLAFSGSRQPLTRDEMMPVVLSAIELVDAYGRTTAEDGMPTETLSRRELECLRWSAAGKSSDEIAVILDLSAYTVTGYLKTAMRKLDSVSRTQAIARAVRYRLL